MFFSLARYYRFVLFTPPAFSDCKTAISNKQNIFYISHFQLKNKIHFALCGMDFYVCRIAFFPHVIIVITMNIIKMYFSFATRKRASEANNKNNNFHSTRLTIAMVF
jgi:hypothetical protein